MSAHDATALTDAPVEVSPLAERVYRAIAAYAWDEAEAWPSQATIAEDLGLTRETVNRCVGELKRAEWLTVTRRRQRGSKWAHNVYELLAEFVTGIPTMRRIIRRAHARRRRPDHTNDVVVGGETSSGCSCRWCRPEPGRFNGPSPLKLARRRWRPAGPGWRDELARRFRRAGCDPDLAYEDA